MTTAPAPHHRPLLPLRPTGTGTRHGSRSYMTCFFRCGNACDHPEPNPTEHRHIQTEIAKAVQRRSLLKGAAAVSGALVGGGLAGPAAPAAAAETGRAAPAGSRHHGRTSFRPVPPNKRDAVTTAEGFDHDVVIRWGDPVVEGAPQFDAFKQSVAAAKTQFGYNCDYVGVLPLEGDRKRALLVVNHE